MSTSISTKLQTLLDEHKESLTDGLYKQFVDLNLDLHKQESTTLYTIKYISTKPIRLSYNHYQTSLEVHKQILKLSEEQVNYIKQRLETNTLCDLCCCIILDGISDQLAVSKKDTCIPIERSECFCGSSDEDNDSNQPSEISIKQACKIISVEKYS